MYYIALYLRVIKETCDMSAPLNIELIADFCSFIFRIAKFFSGRSISSYKFQISSESIRSPRPLPPISPTHGQFCLGFPTLHSHLVRCQWDTTRWDALSAQASLAAFFCGLRFRFEFSKSEPESEPESELIGSP